MFENEYLMQVIVADRLREARATAWRASLARLAREATPAEEPAPCRAERANVDLRDRRALSYK